MKENEKLYEVSVDFTVNKSLYVSATSAEEAERMIKEKLNANPYYDAKTMDSVLDYDIVSVEESDDDEIAEQDELDDCSADMREAIRYIRENMGEDDMTILKAEISKCYDSHIVPGENTVDCDKVIDLLEEYGQENDLPEGWWESECEIDEILLKL